MEECLELLPSGIALVEDAKTKLKKKPIININQGTGDSMTDPNAFELKELANILICCLQKSG